jgi:hypothetical protein
MTKLTKPCFSLLTGETPAFAIRIHTMTSDVDALIRLGSGSLKSVSLDGAGAGRELQHTDMELKVNPRLPGHSQLKVSQFF